MKFKPVKVRNDAHLTTTGQKRKLPAHGVGPWQQLCILIRYQAGESSTLLGKEFNICHQTITRWQRKWGNDTKHVHKAAAREVHAHELREARKALHDLKRQLDRGLAIVDGIIRRHNIEADLEHLYPNDSAELRVTKSY